MARTAAIVGVADTPLRDGVLAEDGTVLQVQARAAKAALNEAGLALRDVDALFAAGSWGVRGPGVFVTSTLAEYLGLRPGYIDGTQIGSSSFEAHVGHAAAAVAQGRCKVALILYGSRQKSDASRTLGARAAVPFGGDRVDGRERPRHHLHLHHRPPSRRPCLQARRALCRGPGGARGRAAADDQHRDRRFRRRAHWPDSDGGL
jgi:acetyl-CoA acetyltransferase